MICLNQRHIGGKTYQCNHCVCCLARRRQQFRTRILLDLAVCPAVTFATVTCDEDKLPKTPQQAKKMIDRLLWHTKPEHRVLLQPERGDASLRWHAHFIDFFHAYAFGDKSYWGPRWPYGHIDIRPMMSQSKAAEYVTKHYERAENEADIHEYLPDGLGMLRPRFPQKPPLGCLIVPYLIEKYRGNSQKLKYIADFHDVEPVIKFDGKDLILPYAVKVYMRKAIGLPTSSPERAEVQALEQASYDEVPGARQRKDSHERAAMQRIEHKARIRHGTRMYYNRTLGKAQKQLMEEIAAGRHMLVRKRKQLARLRRLRERQPLNQYQQQQYEELRKEERAVALAIERD